MSAPISQSTDLKEYATEHGYRSADFLEERRRVNKDYIVLVFFFQFVQGKTYVLIVQTVM